MTDLVAPVDGSHRMASTEHKPSRGNWQTIAVLSLQVLGLKIPTTRFGALVTIAQLRRAVEIAKAKAGE